MIEHHVIRLDWNNTKTMTKQLNKALHDGEDHEDGRKWRVVSHSEGEDGITVIAVNWDDLVATDVVMRRVLK